MARRPKRPTPPKRTSESRETIEGAAPAIPSHLGPLDGVRALAALFVVLHHTWLQFWPFYRGRIPTDLTMTLTGWLFYGRFGVSIFIVLSGYCLMLPVLRSGFSGTLRFFKKRALRLLPAYYASIAICLVLIHFWIGERTGTHWDSSLPVTNRGIVIRLLLLTDLLGRETGEVNHVLWSIAVEWHIYFLFPLFMLIWKRLGIVATTLFTLALGVGGYFVLDETRWSGINAQYFGLFGLGMLSAAISFPRDPAWRRFRDRMVWPAVTAAAAGVTLTLCFSWEWRDVLGNWVVLDFLVGLFACSLLIQVASPKPGLLSRALSLRPLVFIGTFGYSIYLIHAPLLELIQKYLLMPLKLGAEATFVLLIVVGLPLILLAAYGLYWTCERPFLGRSKAIAQPEVAVPVAAESGSA